MQSLTRLAQKAPSIIDKNLAKKTLQATSNAAKQITTTSRLSTSATTSAPAAFNAATRQSGQVSSNMRQFTQTNRLTQNAKWPPHQTTAFSTKTASAKAPLQQTAAQDSAGAKNVKSKLIPIMAGGAVLGTFALQSSVGSEKNYYEYRFTTDKDPDDLAGFYGSEEFMDLFCVVPFVGTLMMRGGEFDDEGGFHTTGIPGTLSVNMVFSDEQDPETGQTQWFNKRERFKDTLGGRTMWDTVMNFGFRKLPNGKVECYHTGEYFKGSAPPVSLAVKLMFQVHARWVAWATEHYLNNYAFTAETEKEEALEEFARKDMPLHLLKNHLLPDIKAMLLGTKNQDIEAQASTQNGAPNNTPSNTKTDSLAAQTNTDATPPDAVILDPTFKPEPKPSFLIQKDQAVEGSVFYDIPINEQLPMQKIKADIKQDKKVQKEVQLNDDDFGRRNLGGNQAWELLRSTNNPRGYQKVTEAALQRHKTRVTGDFQNEDNKEISEKNSAGKF